jgi:predicted ATPase
VTSDGTLRVVALLAALYDPAGAGLICYEEPENGIYPQKLLDLLLVLRSLVTDVRAPGDFPLAQLLLTSHSPVVLSAVPAEQLVVFDWVTRIVPADGERSRVTRARQIRKAGLEPVPLDQVGRYMTEAERRTMIDLDEAAKILG